MASYDIRCIFKPRVAFQDDRDGWVGEVLTITVVNVEDPIVFPMITGPVNQRTRLRSRFVRTLARIKGVERIMVDCRKLHIGKQSDIPWENISPEVDRVVRDYLNLRQERGSRPGD